MTNIPQWFDSLDGDASGGLRAWPIFVFFLCAVAIAYLSISTEQLGQKRLQVHELGQDLSLVTGSGHSEEGTARWIIEIQQLLPQLDYHRLSSSGAIRNSLARVEAYLGTLAALPPGEEVLLRKQLAQAQLELTLLGSQVGRALTRETLIYYLCLIGLIMGVILLLFGRERKFGALWQLMRDEYLFDNLPLGVSLSDARHRLVRVNDAYEKMTGFKAGEVIGQTNWDNEPAGMIETLTEEGSWTGEQTIRKKDGSVVQEKVMHLPIGGEVAEGYLTIALDPVISDSEKQLMLWQAHHDNLTKLPNANLLNERLSRALSTAHVEDKLGALISIDLDGFRQVNDSIGHELADRVLTDVALRIAMCARESDTVARTGSDHFVIAMFEIDSISEAQSTAQSVVANIAPPLFVGEREIFLTASAGVTIFPQDGLDRGELLQKADAARIQAKSQGGNRFAFYEEKMNEEAARRLEIETHLRRAIEKDELALYYQPIVRCETGEIYGAEALLRWHSDELGFVSPGEFIPVAENSGLIREIGEWVVKAVGEQITQWQELAQWPELRISLNVSARQFVEEADAQRLLDMLQACHKDLITVELTESALVADDPGAALFLSGLKASGLQVSLDDFGTGYSSIGYLRDFEFDVLKIDKSFVDGLDAAKEMGLVASIISMGRILGLRIVAEGVEDEAQVEQLRRIGCDYIQGYFYSKPLPADEFASYVLSKTPSV